MKIVVLGSNGMLGHMVYHYLNETGKYEVTGATREQYPINDQYMGSGDFNPSIWLGNKDIVINCIGMLNTKANLIENKLEAIYINSIFPIELAKTMEYSGGRVIHISTDCVFGGQVPCKNELPLINPTNTPMPMDCYGMTKALGEISSPHCTLRQSIIGPQLDGRTSGLFHWVLSREDNENVDGFYYHLWNGITTLQLAKDIEHVIDNKLTGIISNGTYWWLNKNGLIKEIADVFNKNIVVNESKLTYKNMIIENSLHTEEDDTINSMLKDLRIWMQNHTDLYKQYERYLND